MDKLRNKFINFMYGRSGPDSLYKATMIACIVLMIINFFARSTILNLLIWVLLIWGMFRAFSKNIYKRQQENIKFMQLTDKAKRKFNMTKTMLTDKEHCYKKCPKCKTVLRLPKKKGEHTAQCPKCRESFKVKIR